MSSQLWLPCWNLCSLCHRADQAPYIWVTTTQCSQSETPHQRCNSECLTFACCVTRPFQAPFIWESQLTLDWSFHRLGSLFQSKNLQVFSQNMLLFVTDPHSPFSPCSLLLHNLFNCKEAENRQWRQRVGGGGREWVVEAQNGQESGCYKTKMWKKKLWNITRSYISMISLLKPIFIYKKNTLWWLGGEGSSWCHHAAATAVIVAGNVEKFNLFMRAIVQGHRYFSMHCSVHSCAGHATLHMKHTSSF